MKIDPELDELAWKLARQGIRPVRTPEELEKAMNQVVCSGCHKEIDPTVCHCGESIGPNMIHDNHYPIPMGCDCHRAAADVLEDLDELDAFHPECDR